MDLAHRDRQWLFLETRLDQRTDVLEDPVAELVVVIVDLARALGGVDDQRILARRAGQQLVDGRVGDAQRRVVCAGSGRVDVVNSGQLRIGVRGAHVRILLEVSVALGPDQRGTPRCDELGPTSKDTNSVQADSNSLFTTTSSKS